MSGKPPHHAHCLISGHTWLEPLAPSHTFRMVLAQCLTGSVAHNCRRDNRNVNIGKYKKGLCTRHDVLTEDCSLKGSRGELPELRIIEENIPTTKASTTAKAPITLFVTTEVPSTMGDSTTEAPTTLRVVIETLPAKEDGTTSVTVKILPTDDEDLLLENETLLAGNDTLSATSDPLTPVFETQPAKNGTNPVVIDVLPTGNSALLAQSGGLCVPAKTLIAVGVVGTLMGSGSLWVEGFCKGKRGWALAAHPFVRARDAAYSAVSWVRHKTGGYSEQSTTDIELGNDRR